MTLPGEYFDELYRAHADPWGLGGRWYEQRKYDLTLASLPRPHYRSAFEPGCSIGVLTEMLARRCNALLAMDISDACLERAKARHLPPSVRLTKGALPHDWPLGQFDLIVLSEVAYYLSEADLEVVISHIQDSLSADGHLVAAHWRPSVPDYPLDAKQVHQALRNAFGLQLIAQYSDQYVLLDVFATGAAGTVIPPE
jgi:SAM-dependent methyltransferase